MGSTPVGISDVGVYVPTYRLKRAEIARAWGGKSAPGEKAVANYDEDSITLATEATLAALGTDGSAPDGLYFASTTSPYLQKQAASVIAAACNLPPRTDTIDFAGSLRGGTTALRAACNAIRAGAGSSYVVVAADKRPTEPETSYETLGGDAAVAFVLSKDNVAVEIEKVATWSDDFFDEWRKEGDRFIGGDDTRFGQSYGMGRVLKAAFKELAKADGVKPTDLDGIILAASSLKSGQGAVKGLGFDPARQYQELFADKIGYTGTPHVFLDLVGVLAQAKPGQRFVMVGYGDGCDVLMLKTTSRVEDLKKKLDLEKVLGHRRDLRNYEEYLKVRGILGSAAPAPNVTNVLAYEEHRQVLQLHGSRCKKCGFVHYPMGRVCQNCKSKDEMDSVRLSRRGKVFTMTKDNLFESTVSPQLMAVVDLEGGGRIYTQATDFDPDRFEIGVPVELSLRWFHSGGTFHNYFWKARPARS